MRRVVSIWLPHWATDRLRLQNTLPDGPLVTAAHDGRRRTIAAVDALAAEAGLWPGMPVAQGMALVPGLTVKEARWAEDVAALRRLAGWCQRYAPLTAAAPADGIWIDVTGAAHLHGGEARLLRDLLSRLLAQGFAARAAVADTPGAAHAMARFGAEEMGIVPPGGQKAALTGLPLAALRLPAETLDGLRLMGIERIGALAALPRGPLVRRFGALVVQRLEQAFGHAPEPIEPEFPPESIQARLTFVEPLLTAEAFSEVIERLTWQVCATLDRSGRGARQLDLVFERVDGTVQAIRIGTARPSRDIPHLSRLLRERLERVDPGLGVEAMRLLVPRADALAPEQMSTTETRTPDIAPLIDRLANRLGYERVYRAVPVGSAVPERSMRAVPALTGLVDGEWRVEGPRPLRLLDPPQPVEAMALLPDHPPLAFIWRRIRHRVRRADGPERIAGEWWKRNGEMRSVRDYFRVEDDKGARYWLFRRGDGENRSSGDMRWFLHGFF